jgi:hypothetical protein
VGAQRRGGATGIFDPGFLVGLGFFVGFFVAFLVGAAAARATRLKIRKTRNCIWISEIFEIYNFVVATTSQTWRIRGSHPIIPNLHIFSEVVDVPFAKTTLQRTLKVIVCYAKQKAKACDQASIIFGWPPTIVEWAIRYIRAWVFETSQYF